MIAIISTFVTISIAFDLVHDLRCWQYEKNMYNLGITTNKPMSAKIQLQRVMIYMMIITIYGCYMWFILPSMVVPIN